MKLFVDSSSKYLYIDVIDNDLKYSFSRLGKNDHSEMLVSSLEEYLKDGKYYEAKDLFDSINYKDSSKKSKVALSAIYLESGDYLRAINEICNIGGFANINYISDIGLFTKSQETLYSFNEFKEKFYF